MVQFEFEYHFCVILVAIVKMTVDNLSQILKIIRGHYLNILVSFM